MKTFQERTGGRTCSGPEHVGLPPSLLSQSDLDARSRPTLNRYRSLKTNSVESPLPTPNDGVENSSPVPMTILGGCGSCRRCYFLLDRTHRYHVFNSVGPDLSVSPISQTLDLNLGEPDRVSDTRTLVKEIVLYFRHL